MTTTTRKTLITSDSPRGCQATELFRGAYNKAKLTKDPAQILNMNKDGVFTSDLVDLIKKHSKVDQYSHEEVYSNYDYPYCFKFRKPIDQVKTISDFFGLDPTHALKYIQRLPPLPEGAEFYGAFPDVSVLARKFFPSIEKSEDQYCEATRLCLRELQRFGNICGLSEKELIPEKLRQTSLSLDFIQKIKFKQRGDILIIPVQYGKKYRGKSTKRTHEKFSENEFDLGLFHAMCMSIIHPDRFSVLRSLGIFCAGDEFSPKADGNFWKVPSLSKSDSLVLDMIPPSYYYNSSGLISGFLPNDCL